MLNFKIKFINSAGNVEFRYCPYHHIKSYTKKLKDNDNLILYTLPSFHLRNRRIAEKEWIEFFNNLNILLSTGLQLLPTLQHCHSITGSAFFKMVIQDVCHKLNQGKSFTRALEEAYEAVPAIIIHVLKVAEYSGEIQNSVATLYEYLFWRHKMKTSFMQSIRYPALLIMVFTTLTYFLSTVVAPQMIEFLHTLGCETDDAELFVMFATICAEASILALFCGIMFWACFKVGAFSRYTQIYLHKIILKITLVKFYTLARFFHSLHICLRNEIDLLLSMEISANSLKNTHFKYVISDIREGLKNGKSLSIAFSEHDLFPDFVLKLIHTSHFTGNLAQVCRNLCDFFEQSVQNNLKTILSFIEPSIVLCVGGLILLIVKLLLLPLYEQMAFLPY